MAECNKEGVNMAGVMGRSLGMEGTWYSGMSVVVVLEAREASGVLVTGAAGSVGVIVGSRSESSKIWLSVRRERCGVEVLTGWENQVSLYIWMLKADCKGCGRGA